MKFDITSDAEYTGVFLTLVDEPGTPCAWFETFSEAAARAASIAYEADLKASDEEAEFQRYALDVEYAG